MTHNSQVRPCTECGWPALANTRRCPYCRTRVPGMGRHLTMPLLGRDVLRWAAAGWFLVVTALTAAALMLTGWPPAAGGLLVAAGPAGFLVVLHQRSAMRIRRLGREAGAGGVGGRRALGGLHAHPEKPPRDAGRR